MLHTLSASKDYEISCTANSNVAKGFAFALRQSQDTLDTYMSRVGVKGDSKKFGSIAVTTTDSVTASNNSYTANSNINFKIVREGSTIKIYVDEREILYG